MVVATRRGAAAASASARAAGAPPPAGAGAPKLPSLGDFEGLLAFYLAFHSDGVNQAIHFVFIPLIAWSLLVGAAYAPVPAALSELGGLPLLTLAGYSAYYTWLSPPLGAAWACTLGVGIYTGVKSFVAGAASPAAALKLAGYTHVGSWVAQFIGHGLFERRAPSLFTGIGHSFLAAPFFVFVEAAFALGFMPELHKRVRGRAYQIRRALDDAKAK